VFIANPVVVLLCLGEPGFDLFGGPAEGGVHECLGVGEQGDGGASGFPLVHRSGVDAEMRGEGTDAQAHGQAKCLGLGSGPALNSGHKAHLRSSQWGPVVLSVVLLGYITWAPPARSLAAAP
jgi:hypothetical protein